MINTPRFGICDVCRLLDFNTEPRPCTYCSLCDAWICAEDANRWDRRIRAAIKRKLEHDYRGLPNYEEVAVKEQQNAG